MVADSAHRNGELRHLSVSPCGAVARRQTAKSNGSSFNVCAVRSIDSAQLAYRGGKLSILRAKILAFEEAVFFGSKCRAASTGFDPRNRKKLVSSVNVVPEQIE
jgi:hypothetical protein